VLKLCDPATIRLHSNPEGFLTAVNVMTISRMKNLRSLEIHAMKLPDLKFLSKLSGLRELFLTFVEVVDHQSWRHLSALSELTKLSLSRDVCITDGGLEYVGSLRKLDQLHLSYNRRITDAGVEQLANIPNLTLLDLSWTSVSGSTLHHLKDLRITHLKLDGSQVTDDNLKRLHDFRYVEYINLDGCTKLTTRGVEDLRYLCEAAPSLKELDIINTQIGVHGLTLSNKVNVKYT